MYFYLTPPYEQDVIQGQFFIGVQLVWIQFFFLLDWFLNQG